MTDPILSTSGPTSLPEQVRAAAARVTATTTHVRLDLDGLDRVVAMLGPQPNRLPEETVTGSEEDRARAVLAWNTVNFGSGWFPDLRKLPGRSGARTLATHWKARCDERGVPSTYWLADVAVDEVAALFGQEVGGSVHDLLEAFVESWNTLGIHLLEAHDGSAMAMVDACAPSGGLLAAELAALTGWGDVHDHPSGPVPLYKPAQITVAHLADALTGAVGFDDLASLTAFADNLVPHVLKMTGALVLDPDLDARIERGERLRSGEAGEVELRAVAVHAVEGLVRKLRAQGRPDITPAAVDYQLWRLGQDPRIKARPRHRCRCTFY